VSLETLIGQFLPIPGICAKWRTSSSVWHCPIYRERLADCLAVRSLASRLPPQTQIIGAQLTSYLSDFENLNPVQMSTLSCLLSASSGAQASDALDILSAMILSHSTGEYRQYIPTYTTSCIVSRALLYWTFSSDDIFSKHTECEPGHYSIWFWCKIACILVYAFPIYLWIPQISGLMN